GPGPPRLGLRRAGRRRRHDRRVGRPRGAGRAGRASDRSDHTRRGRYRTCGGPVIPRVALARAAPGDRAGAERAGGRLMLLLGIETATRRVGVVLSSDDGMLARVELGGYADHGPPRHAEQLAPAIEYCCAEIGTTLDHVS